METRVDARAEVLVAFKVGKGGSESVGSRTVDDNCGGVNDRDKSLLNPMGRLLDGLPTLVLDLGEGGTDRPIEFDGNAVGGALTLDTVPVPGSSEDRTTEEGL